MFESRLFLGYPIRGPFQKEYQNLNQEILDIFIQPNSVYLEKIQFNGTTYLGKYVPVISNLQSLELLEANVYILLKKLHPSFPFQDTPLTLFPISS